MRQLLAIFIAITALFTMHTNASAYSYGDPNEEKIAEAYKSMLVKLDENPPNFAEAKQIYATVQEEIDMHMGAEPSKAVLGNIENKQKEELVQNMEKVLALNINRRLANVEQQFTDYETSKRLLAKAYATYGALSPVVAEADKELDAKMKSAFDQALEALGNPGLFGVGKKEASKEAFVKQKDFILDNLKATFHITDFKVGHFDAAGTETEATVKNTDWTDLGNVKNWLPLLVIAGVVIGIVVYALRKRK